LAKKIYFKSPELDVWLKDSTVAMRARLSELSGISSVMFRQWVVGTRGMTAESAAKIENATTIMADTVAGAPKPLLRGALCKACQACPYFTGAKK
jgi:DNA-binding transcriptional regulator YdaS (Cro superfamily)